jgi:hypothetical protein
VRRDPQFLLAVDPSLTQTGWALFELKSEKLLKSGVLSPTAESSVLEHRLASLQEGIQKLFEYLGLDFRFIVICEAPAPLVKNPNSALKVERVRGMFENIARFLGAHVPGRLNPRTIQVELLGLRGRQLGRADVKSIARTTCERLYGEELLKTWHSFEESKKKILPQDIIDAILIGAVAISRIQRALLADQALEEVFQEGQGAIHAGRYSGWRGGR